MSSSRYCKLSIVGFALLALACAEQGDIQRPHMGAISGAGADEGEDSNKSESEGVGSSEPDGGAPEADAGASDTPDAAAEAADAGSAVADGASEVADAGSESDAAQAAAEGPGLPCEVEALLKTHCQGCHGAQAKNGVPLTTHAQLSAASKADASETFGERALARMASSDRPMPPAGKSTPVSADELAAFAAWIDDGTPNEQCEQ